MPALAISPRSSVDAAEWIADLPRRRFDQLPLALQDADRASFPVVAVLGLPFGDHTRVNAQHAMLVQGQTVAAQVLGDAGPTGLAACKKADRPEVWGGVQL